MHFNKTTKVIVTGLVLSLAAAGAYAYWTGGGGGSGTAAVGTTSGTVTITATVAQGIAPGTSRAVSFTAANPSSSPIFVTTVHLVSKVADGQHVACAVTDADFTMDDVNVNHEVPALATAESLGTTGSLVYHDTGANQDACKGATLTLTLSST